MGESGKYILSMLIAFFSWPVEQDCIIAQSISGKTASSHNPFLVVRRRQMEGKKRFRLRAPDIRPDPEVARQSGVRREAGWGGVRAIRTERSSRRGVMRRCGAGDVDVAGSSRRSRTKR